MKFRQVLMNRKIVITTIASILALCIGIVFLIGSRQTNSENTKTGIKTEQDNDDVVVSDDNKSPDVDNKADIDKNESANSLKPLEPNEVSTENITDASGSWGDTQESGQNSKNESDNDGKTEQDGDILQDNITWGEIY